MITFLTVILVLACFILVVSVLLQPAKSGGLTALGGTSQSIFGSTGGTTFLFRLSMWCGAIIMGISLLIARLQMTERKSSVFDKVTTNISAPTTGATTDAAKPVEASATPDAAKAADAAGKPAAAPVEASKPAPVAPAKTK
jgi:preprotein translocase subunit SecG